MSSLNPIPRATRRQDLVAAAGQSVFGVTGFRVYDPQDVRVRVKAPSAAYFSTLTSGFMVSLAPGGLPAFAQVTFAPGRSFGDIVRLEGAMTPSRTTDVTLAGTIRSAPLETELDRYVMVSQELRRDLDDIFGPLDAGAVSAAAAALASAQQAAASAATALSAVRRTLPAVGAVSRTIIDVSQDRIDAREFGVAYDGSDETAKLQAALTAMGAVGGGALVLSGPVTISAGLNITGDNISLTGTNRRKAILIQTNPAAPILTVYGGQCGLHDVSFLYTGTPVAGGNAVVWNGANGKASNIVIYSCFNGWVQAAHDIRIEGLCVYNYEYSAWSNTATVVGAWVINFSFVAGTVGDRSKGRGGGIRLTDYVESCAFMNGEVLSGLYSLVTGAAVYGITQRPAYNSFTNVYFDSAQQGSIIDKMVLSEFVNCWVSTVAAELYNTGPDDVGQPALSSKDGLTIRSSSGIGFTNCRFINNAGNGVSVESSSNHISFVNCMSCDNGSGRSGSHGIYFQPGTKDFTVTSCTFANGYLSGFYPGRNTYGVFVDNGASDRYIVAGNRGQGNLSGTFYDGGTGASKVVTPNL